MKQISRRQPLVLFGAMLVVAAGCSSGDGGAAAASSGGNGGSSQGGAAGHEAGPGAGGAAGYDAGPWAGGAAGNDAGSDASGGTTSGGTGGSGAGGTAGAGGSTSPPPKCGANAKTGDYCGGDKVLNADKNTLYHCNGPGAPTSAKKCSNGCVVAAAGYDDYCKLPVSKKSYRLPWTHGVTMKLTQDCNDSCCTDHVGPDEYAWDWGNTTHFVVRAARGGTITHMKLSSDMGGGSSTYSHYVNMIVVDHGDGTQAIYMHLRYNSAKAGITCGAHVTQGQALAVSGTTGHSTGIHLHFQVSKVHPGVATCECGKDGLHCAKNWNPFPNVWVSSTYPTVPISFEEWPAASKCANRRITMPQSLN